MFVNNGSDEWQVLSQFKIVMKVTEFQTLLHRLE